MMKGIRRITQSKTLYGLLMLLVFWYFVHIVIKSSIVPNPYETLLVFIKLIRGDLLIHLGVSMLRIIASVAISMIIGVPLGLWIGANKKADAIISPVVYILYPIPKIAFLPVLMLLFGLGNTSKIILIITIVILQIILATRDGVREIPIQLYYSVKSIGLNTLGTYLHLIIPAVLPRIFSALRISVGISISVLFFSENFATSYGMGHFIMHTWSILKYKEMFAGIVALSLMGFFIFKCIDLVEKRLCSWMFIEK
jgi:NitT/TauT family transport system permease protein